VRPTFEAYVKTDDGEEISGQVMYVVLWEGKAISGHERLLVGDEIVTMELRPAS
jgi:hypothetical protein